MPDARTTWVHLRTRVATPANLTTATQTVKAVFAGTVAWWIATEFVHSRMAFLAPWTALLVVHVTVRRTFSSAVQTLVATLGGVLLAYVAGSVIDASTALLAVVLLLGMVVSRLPGLRLEGITVATTGLFVVVTNAHRSEVLLVDRVWEVVLGLVTGLLVNLLVVPPLRDNEAVRDVVAVRNQMGALLSEIGTELRDSWDSSRADAWMSAIDEMDVRLRRSSSRVDLAQESRWLNPRAGWGAIRHVDAEGIPRDVLERLRRASSYVRSMVTQINRSTHAEAVWDDDFRQRWCGIVSELGATMQGADHDLRQAVQHLDTLQADMSHAQLPAWDWASYGYLIAGLRELAHEVHVTTVRTPPGRISVRRGMTRAARRLGR